MDLLDQVFIAPLFPAQEKPCLYKYFSVEITISSRHSKLRKKTSMQDISGEPNIYLVIKRNDMPLNATVLEIMSEASLNLRNGDMSEAVRKLAIVFVYVVSTTKNANENSSIERPLNYQMPLDSEDWPQLGTRFSRLDGEASVIFFRSEFSPLEAKAYFSFVRHYLGFIQSNRQIVFQKTWQGYYRILRFFCNEMTKNILVYSMKVVNKLFPTRIRDLLVRELIILHSRVAGSHDSAKDHFNTHIISYLFSVSRSQARRIYLENKAEFNDHWKLKRLRNPRLMHTVSWDAENDFVAFVKNLDRPVVFASVHMCMHSHALKKIRMIYDAHSDQKLVHLALKDNLDSELEYAEAFSSYSWGKCNYERLTTMDMNLLSVVSRLRKGECSLYSYIDLSSAAGVSHEVTFFGQRARFAKGIVELAIMAKVPIVPLVTFMDGGRSYMRSGGILDTALIGTEGIDEGCIRILQKVVSFSEQYIKKYPDQWTFLGSTHIYLMSEDGILGDP